MRRGEAQAPAAPCCRPTLLLLTVLCVVLPPPLRSAICPDEWLATWEEHRENVSGWGRNSSTKCNGSSSSSSWLGA